MQTLKSIPFVEPFLTETYANEVQKQILSGFIGPNFKTNEFSNDLAKYTGVPHCLLTVSGTVALSVAAKGLGLLPGDEILVPAYGVISTINAFASIGLKPRLVEIERSTGCMSPEDLLQKISENTRAVCFVNFSGYTGPNLIEIKKICDEKGIPLIEDAACALGQNYKGFFAGTFGTVGIYSFSVPKILTTGQGGAIVTKESNIFEKAASFIDQGDLNWRKTNLNNGIGTNLRFNDILATLGHSQLKDLDLLLERKRKVFEVLKHELDEYIYRVPGNEAPLHYIIFTKNPNDLIELLQNKGVSAKRQYRTLSQHPIYKDLAEQNYPHSDFWTNHAVYLPFGVTLTPEDAEYIAHAIRESKIELLRP